MLLGGLVEAAYAPQGQALPRTPDGAKGSKIHGQMAALAEYMFTER